MIDYETATKEDILNSAEFSYEVYHLPLPNSVYGTCLYYPNKDKYMILINSNKTETEQVRTYIHEVTHIKERHHHNDITPTKVIEELTETKTKEMIQQLQAIKTIH